MNDGLPVHDLPRLCVRAAQLWPAKAALVFDATGDRLTFSELDSLSNAYANALAGIGIRPGERIAVMLPNCIEYLIAQQALARLGATAVQIGYRLKPNARIRFTTSMPPTASSRSETSTRRRTLTCW